MTIPVQPTRGGNIMKLSRGNLAILCIAPPRRRELNFPLAGTWKEETPCSTVINDEISFELLADEKSTSALPEGSSRNYNSPALILWHGEWIRHAYSVPNLHGVSELPLSTGEPWTRETSFYDNWDTCVFSDTELALFEKISLEKLHSRISSRFL